MIRFASLGGLFFLSILLTADAFASKFLVGRCNTLNTAPDVVGSAPRDMLQAKLERPLRARSGYSLPDQVRGTGGAMPGLRMSAEIEGEWDRVRGFVTLPLLDEDGRFETTIRGFMTDRVDDTNEYVVPAWDRTIFWVRFNDGLPGDVPRLVKAIEIDREYQPAPDDGFDIFEADELVQQYCTGVNFCSIQFVPYVELREPGVDYSEYPNGASESVIFFVVDHEGDIIAIVIDIYDADDEFVESRYLQIDDGLEFFSVAFKIDEPDVFYLAQYMEERDVTDNFGFEMAYYTPGVDFIDPDLPADFDAPTQRVQFLLEGVKTVNREDIWALSGPFDLGFDWQSLPEYIFRSNFRASEPDIPPARAASSKAPLIKPARNHDSVTPAAVKRSAARCPT